MLNHQCYFQEREMFLLESPCSYHVVAIIDTYVQYGGAMSCKATHVMMHT